MSDYLELEKRVNSKETFLCFLEALADDWHDMVQKETQSPSGPYSLRSANDWENPQLGPFLEAMSVWALTEYTATGEPHVPEEPSWQTFARMLAAAKTYE